MHIQHHIVMYIFSGCKRIMWCVVYTYICWYNIGINFGLKQGMGNYQHIYARRATVLHAAAESGDLFLGRSFGLDTRELLTQRFHRKYVHVAYMQRRRAAVNTSIRINTMQSQPYIYNVDKLQEGGDGDAAEAARGVGAHTAWDTAISSHTRCLRWEGD